MRHYIALIHKDPGSDYGVSFPDLPGCITAGANLDQARARAAEVLACHVEGLTEDGDPIPEPSSLEQVMADRDNRDGVAVLVPLEASANGVLVDVAIPEELLDRLDRFAAGRGMDRSGFLVQAAREAIKADADPAVG